MCRISHVDFFGSLALFVFESIIFEGKGLDKVFDELKFTETEKSFEKFSKLQGKSKKLFHACHHQSTGRVFKHCHFYFDKSLALVAGHSFPSRVTGNLIIKQKQSFADLLQNRCFLKFRKFYRKARTLETLFNKVAVLQVFKFIKKRLQHRCFPLKFAQFLRTPIYRTPPVATSE